MQSFPSGTEAVITAYYEHFNRQNWEGMLGLLAPTIAHDVNQGDREVGIAAFRAFLGRMDRCYRERLSDIRICVSADGTRAAAEYVVHGEYLQGDEGLPPAHGQRYILPGGAFFEVNDGRIARVTNYYNLPDWIRQVGG